MERVSSAALGARCDVQHKLAPGLFPLLLHAVAPSKGRLIRWTVLGSTPNRAAIFRTLSPVSLRTFRADRMRASVMAGRGRWSGGSSCRQVYRRAGSVPGNRQNFPYFRRSASIGIIEEVRTILAAKKQALNLFGEVKWSKITVNYHKKYIDLIECFFDLIAASKVKIQSCSRRTSFARVGH